MSVIYHIRRHIFAMPLDEICTTSDFLKYGIRSSIDSSLSRLVGKGILIRVADGVFLRAGSRIPTAQEIAIAKAGKFGKEVVEYCGNLAAELSISSDQCDPDVFGTDGRTSSFDTIHGRVKLVHVGGRRRRIGTSKSAKAARSLWFMKEADYKLTATALASLNKDDRQKLEDLICWMPASLSNQFVRRVRPKKKIVQSDTLC